MAQGMGLGVLAVAVAYSRIYLGYHSTSQVRAEWNEDSSQPWHLEGLFLSSPCTMVVYTHIRLYMRPALWTGSAEAHLHWAS